MSGADFWRLPPPNADFESSDDEKTSTKVASNAGPIAVVKEKTQAAPELVLEAEGTSQSSSSTKAKQLSLPTWSFDSNTGGFSTDCKDPFDLDEESVSKANYPVRLASLSEYLCKLRARSSLEPASLHNAAQVPPSGVARYCLAAQLAEESHVDLPADFLIAETMSGLSSSLKFRLGDVDVAEVTSSSSELSWRSLYAGSLVAPDPAICGDIGPVPPLPELLTIWTDVPVIVEKMLESIPEEYRDTKRFTPPTPIAGFQNLGRGPGGLLAAYTPRQLAQNALVAAILNRLCANFLSVAAATDSQTKAPKQTPEEAAVSTAKAKIDDLTKGLQKAIEEESAAKEEKRCFERDDGFDMDRARRLESIVGWKSGVREQHIRDIEEAQNILKQAEEALAASRARAPSKRWHEVWARVVPEDASKEQLFSVRLTPRGTVLWSVKDFLQAMQTGLRDDVGTAYVQKHRLDAFFVRNAADSSMLCLREEGKAEASQWYTHIPTPELVSSGLADADGHEIRTARPQHCFRLFLDGPNFPFTVCFGAIRDSMLGFTGYGLNALTYQTPWNPLEYTDMLWAQETIESLSVLPVLACLSGLVNDRQLCIGPFPPLQSESRKGIASSIPLALVGLGLLQASLVNDCKIWPVQLPDLVRLRWEHAMRSLRYELSQRTDSDRSDKVDIDVVHTEVIPRCLEVLPKLPNDDGLGIASGGNSGGFSYRLQRMETSQLSTTHLRCVETFQSTLTDLQQLWPQFTVDTGGAF